MFITTNIAKRHKIFAEAPCARIAVETLFNIQDFYPFFLHGFVIMPDHCHFLIRVPEGGSISKIIGVYKRAVTFNIGRGPIWQSRFHMIIPRDPIRALEYIHKNPVVAGLTASSEKYPWSSASGKWDIHQL